MSKIEQTLTWFRQCLKVRQISKAVTFIQKRADRKAKWVMAAMNLQDWLPSSTMPPTRKNEYAISRDRHRLN